MPEDDDTRHGMQEGEQEVAPGTIPGAESPDSGDGEPGDGEPGDGETVLSEMEQLVVERDEYLDQLRRVQAEFENYRKRVLREQTALVERATGALVEKLLPMLDAFELALFNADTVDPDKLRKGVELVYAEMLGTLEQFGLERIEAQGEVFDPMFHEAVVQVEAVAIDEDGGAGIVANTEPMVVDVLRTGYKLGGKLLRAAMVKVAK